MLLELASIQKRYGGVTALHDAHLQVSSGEVHLLMGENGAGKSTLVKIIAGMLERDSGRMLWRDREVFLRNPGEAAAIGISMVHQESLLAPHLTVAENLFLGREPRAPLGWVSRGKMSARARDLIERFHFPLEPDILVAKLSPAGRQMVEICRALHHGSHLLIFDEPTSSLSARETDQVFHIVRGLRATGAAIVYITHRLEELREIGDRVTVLRDGATVHTSALQDLTTDQLVERMVGRPVSSTFSRAALPPGKLLMEVDHLSSRRVQDISFQLHAGEIVGVAGLNGAGRTALCRVLFGVDPVFSGSVRIGGQPIALRSPRDAIRAGIALVTEDRQRTGLASRLSLSSNLTLANLPAISPYGLLQLAREAAGTEELIAQLHIRCQSQRQPAGSLSGGNQQKLAIAKWLFRKSSIFLFDEPTRGIDVGAKAEIFRLMNDLARAGAAILMVSSELQELQQVADRILVVRAGRIAGELPGTAPQAEILKLAAWEKIA